MLGRWRLKTFVLIQSGRFASAIEVLLNVQKLRLHKVRRRLRELPENISPWNFDNRHRSYSIWSILCETADILVFFKKYSANQRMNSELNDHLLRQFVNLKSLKRWKICQNGQAFRVAEMSDSSDNSWETLRKEKSPFFNYHSPSPIIKSYTRKKNPEESKPKVRRRLLDIGNVKSKLRKGCRKKSFWFLASKYSKSFGF